MLDFAGKVGAVTGAARGIGRAVADEMGRRGMRVVVSDVAAARPADVARALRDEGIDAEGVECDVRDPEQVDHLAAQTVARFGRIDVLCNNAGVVTGGPTWEIPLTEWARVLEVNLWGAIYGIHAFVPRMLGNEEGGHVVNVASLAAVTPVRGIAPYNVAKHGLLALSETLAADLRAAGSTIGVTVVMPGRVATGIGLPSGHEAADVDGDPDAGILTAAAVASRVMEAVENDRLYLFTHPERMEDVETRFAQILGR
jgi:NAD(P)-dependent dehydrogenase (short-subunit alcohol dehydrogenase family)